jgi:hypothetical protein
VTYRFNSTFFQPENALVRLLIFIPAPRSLLTSSTLVWDLSLVELASQVIYFYYFNFNSFQLGVTTSYIPATCSKCDVNAASIACNYRGTVANLTTCSGCICKPLFTGPTCQQCNFSCGSGGYADPTQNCNCKCNLTYWSISSTSYQCIIFLYSKLIQF